MSVDPLQHKYPHYTPYQYAGNKPITYIDLDGLEEADTDIKYKKRNDRIRKRLQEREIKELEKAGINLRTIDTDEERKQLDKFYEDNKDKRWLKKLRHLDFNSKTTDYTFSPDSPIPTESMTNSNRQTINFSGYGQSEKTYNVWPHNNYMIVNYNMLNKKDELVIRNAETGEVIFETGDYVKGVFKSNKIYFELHSDSREIIVTVNPGEAQKGSKFEYSIVLSNDTNDINEENETKNPETTDENTKQTWTGLKRQKRPQTKNHFK